MCLYHVVAAAERNKQEIITHAYTAIALVAVAVEVYLIYLPKTEYINGKITNSQTSRKTNEVLDCTKRQLRVQKTSPV